jgi:protein-L-isoaspartate(D-aspartate) O-methyltransferase
MHELIRNLMDAGFLKTPEIIAAFRKIDRADFVPTDMKDFAYENMALPVGWGQTISQPQVVAFMLELLEPKEGEKILDVGSGSGWQTALLASIVGDKGKVVAIERVPEVFDFGKKNLEKYALQNMVLLQGDGTEMIRPAGYFDKIIIAASGESLPPTIKQELRPGGKIVAPIRESIFVFTKTGGGHLTEKEFPGFLFVPLIRD